MYSMIFETRSRKQIIATEKIQLNETIDPSINHILSKLQKQKDRITYINQLNGTKKICRSIVGSKKKNRILGFSFMV